MVDKLESLGGTTKSKFRQNVGEYFDQMKYKRPSSTFQFEKVPSAKK